MYFVVRKYLKWFDYLKQNEWATQLFYLFLATDVVFIVIHFVHSYTPFLSNSSFSLQTERGYSEILQYVKEYWTALILIFLGWRSRLSIYTVWGLLFFYLLLDDSGEIHERVGFFISRAFFIPPILNLRPEDLGELIVSGVVGLCFFPAIAIAYRAGDRFSREITRSLIFLLCALAFCGVVMDMVHMAIQQPALNPFLIALEDGGEMVVMSCIASFVLSFSLHKKETPTLKKQFAQLHRGR